MKLLCLYHAFSTPRGSMSTRSYEIARRLAERAHAVSVVCLTDAQAVTGLDSAFRQGKREGKVDGIEVTECRSAAWFIAYAAKALLSQEYDRLWTSFGWCAVLGRWMRQKTAILEVRDLPAPVRSMQGVLETLFYRSAQRMVALSPGIAEGLAQRGVAKTRIAMIPGGCDLALFAAPVAAWRPEQVRSEDVMAVYAGAHDAASGLDVVLDVMAELKRRNANHIKLVLVGDGPTKQGLKARAEREGLTNLLLLDAVPKTRLAGLLASAHLGLQLSTLPSARYHGTDKFFDYIAAGIPVLINHPGWLAEMVTLHQCGFMVPRGDVKAFADTLVYAAGNRTELKAMGPRAQQLARTAFARDQLAEKFCQWLEGTAA